MIPEPERQPRRKIAARAVSVDAELPGIPSKLRSMLRHPEVCADAVIQRCRIMPALPVRQRIFNRDDHRRNPARDLDAATEVRIQVAGDPAAPVDVQNHRKRFLRCRTIDADEKALSFGQLRERR